MDTRFYNLLTVVFICLSLSGCGPKITTTLSGPSSKPLSADQEVYILQLSDMTPDSCKLIAKLKIGDTGFTTDCKYGSVMEKAKMEARKVGGNIVKLTEVKEPGFKSSCYQIKADILYKQDTRYILEPTPRQLAMEDSITKAKFGGAPNFAILYVYRPKNSLGVLIGYDMHIGDSVICRAQHNTAHQIKLYKEGKTEVWAKTESREAVTVDVKFGEEYFLRCAVSMGAFVGRPEFYLVNKVQGRSEFEKVGK